MSLFQRCTSAGVDLSNLTSGEIFCLSWLHTSYTLSASSIDTSGDGYKDGHIWIVNNKKNPILDFSNIDQLQFRYNVSSKSGNVTNTLSITIAQTDNSNNKVFSTTKNITSTGAGLTSLTNFSSSYSRDRCSQIYITLSSTDGSTSSIVLNKCVLSYFRTVDGVGHYLGNLNY